MAATSIQKWKERVETMKRSASNRRARAKTNAVLDTGVQFGTGYVVGRIEQDGEIPSMFGVDGKLIWGAGAAVAGTTVAGRSGELLTSVARGLLTCAAYSAGKTGSFEGV